MKKRLIILDREPMGQLEERLKRRGSPGVVIIDSFQYSGLSYPEYKEFKERHPKSCSSSSAMPRECTRLAGLLRKWNTTRT